MLFKLTRDTNNPKVLSRSGGRKLMFKGPGLFLLKKKKVVLKNVNRDWRS